MFDSYNILTKYLFIVSNKYTLCLIIMTTHDIATIFFLQLHFFLNMDVYNDLFSLLFQINTLFSY